MAAIVSSIATVLAITAICCTVFFSCGKANDNYYVAYKQCVESGGSWVPSGGQSSYNAICFKGTK